MSEQRDIAERGFDEVGGVSTPADHARVTAGPLAEPADAWVAYRAEVARYYGAEGPVELAVVDRIVSLQARLRRLERGERGALTAATVGIHWRQQMGRVHKATDDHAYSLMRQRGILSTSNAIAAQRVLLRFRDFIDAAKDTFPSPAAVGAMLAEVYGVENKDPLRFQGQGETAFLYYRLSMSSPPAAEPDREDLVAKVQGLFIAELEKARDALEGLIDGLNDDDLHTDVGKAEAKALPTKADVHGTAVMEKHLQQQVTHAVRELERMVARRRLAEAGRRLSRG